MADLSSKQIEQLQTTKHTEENSIIQEKVSSSQNGECVKRYLKGKLLGKGGFARCYEVTNVETKKVSAIKIVDKANLKKSKAKQKLITEIKIHKSLKHKNIVGFDHVFEDNNNVYILLQLCNNHTLNELMKKRKRISELQAQYFLSQIVSGLSYINGCKVIHRDLKLGNLMLNENMELKIGDFGLAAKLQFLGEKRKTVCGTPNYIAPQILQGKDHSYEVDVWSLGAILFALLYGRPPFETSDVKKTYKKIKECQYAFNEDVPISHTAKNLISRMLIVDPVKRFTLDQVRDHPFLNQYRIPKNLPTSILTTPLPKSFMEQYPRGRTCLASQIGTKNNEKSEIKLTKGVSERLIMKQSNGNVSRNGCGTASSNSRPSLIKNNFFATRTNFNQSSKKAKDAVLNNVDVVFVKKWVDYSSKYGLGYLLSNGCTGIYFNDSSKMVLHSDSDKIDYLKSNSELETFSLSKIPDSRQISKKITLMQYFQKYLNDGRNLTTEKKKQAAQPPFVYVKEWSKSSQAIIFRLNNCVLQINFNDKSQLVIYTEKAVGVFSDSKSNGERFFFKLGTNDLQKNRVLLNRMQQVKSLIGNLQTKSGKQKYEGEEGGFFV